MDQGFCYCSCWLFFLCLQLRSLTIQGQNRICGLLSAKCWKCDFAHWHRFLLLKLMFAFLPCLPKGTCTSLVCNRYFCFLHPRQKLWIWPFHPLGLTGRIASMKNQWRCNTWLLALVSSAAGKQVKMRLCSASYPASAASLRILVQLDGMLLSSRPAQAALARDWTITITLPVLCCVPTLLPIGYKVRMAGCSTLALRWGPSLTVPLQMLSRGWEGEGGLWPEMKEACHVSIKNWRSISKSLAQ